MIGGVAKRACPCGVCESWNQPAICASCVNFRLIENYKLLKRLSQDCEALRSHLNLLLKAKREADEQHHWRLEHAEHISKLQDCLLAGKEKIVKGKSRQEQMQISLENCTKLLASASDQLTRKKTQQLGQFYPDLIRAQRLHHTAVAAEVSQKRRQVMRQLCKVLPLRCLTAGDARAQGRGGNAIKQFLICGARLPNGEEILSLPPNEVAASLGYMVHLVNLAARYMAAPLLHSAVFAASSSRIWQQNSYWDARPASHSEEYPLFVPRKGSQSGVSVESIRLEKSSSNSGYLSLEKPSYDESSDRGMSSIALISTRPQEMHNDVEKGMKLLNRSVTCILTYGYDLFSLPVPSNLSTYEAFAELLSIFSSKEARLRATYLLSARHASGDGSLERIGVSTSGLQDQVVSSCPKHSFGGMVDNLHGSIHVGGDYERLEGVRKPMESLFDGWDLVEHPTLPPPPCLSEDVEHWTRAMFVDATK
ncbi:hypothetical protein O6H91_01G131100 [Diphasiastrum complanatum]|uniref:Uncharacterized protein n=2 Tax=Diphasiastrum complanatum TaxID=34168 RepID=A0ACC2EW33_DIPCM|nr:hypothetical protein O6H91_01G131100 [Diphasiastrum complanatum]KAJ7570679.1 hypothetical protein O6H91_01G131100 [Diphasiastrum complanatum]